MYTYTYMYMGKNYTLYIKDQRFADESNKGGLINRLLEEHYRLPPLRDKPLNLRKPVDTITISSSEVPMTADNPQQLKEVLKDDYVLCKHSSDPELCKYAKPGKKCK